MFALLSLIAPFRTVPNKSFRMIPKTLRRLAFPLSTFTRSRSTSYPHSRILMRLKTWDNYPNGVHRRSHQRAEYSTRHERSCGARRLYAGSEFYSQGSGSLAWGQSDILNVFELRVAQRLLLSRSGEARRTHGNEPVSRRRIHQ